MRVFTCSLENLEDEELVALAQEDFTQAYNLIVKRYAPLVKARTKLFYLAGSEKDDIIQEGMIGLYYSIRGYDREKDTLFRVFADICVTRAVASAIKKFCRIKHGPLNNAISINSESEFSLKTAVDPLKKVLKKERIEILYDYLRKELTKCEKKVLLKYLDELTYKQIALYINGDEKTVDNAIQRIRRKTKTLKNSLK